MSAILTGFRFCRLSSLPPTTCLVPGVVSRCTQKKSKKKVGENDGISRGTSGSRAVYREKTKRFRRKRLMDKRRTEAAARRCVYRVAFWIYLSSRLSLSITRSIVVGSTRCRLVPVRASFATPVLAPPLPPPYPKPPIVHCHYHRHAFSHHFANYFYLLHLRFIINPPTFDPTLVPREMATQRRISALQANQLHHATWLCIALSLERIVLLAIFFLDRLLRTRPLWIFLSFLAFPTRMSRTAMKHLTLSLPLNNMNDTIFFAFRLSR